MGSPEAQRKLNVGKSDKGENRFVLGYEMGYVAAWPTLREAKKANSFNAFDSDLSVCANAPVCCGEKVATGLKH
jgi:hypothetical protein